MVPTVLVELIFAAGVVKLGWFKALAMVIVNRSTIRSRIFISFKSPKSRLRIGMPERMLKPELPNLPMGAALLHTGVAGGQPGTANAA